MLIMDNRIALVTGGSSGIGRSLCLNLAMDGYRVFSVSRSKKLASDMNHITQITADLSIPEQTIAFAQKFLLRYGTPDLLFNNAGYGAYYEWGDFPDNEITKQIEVLFSTPIRLCRLFAPTMQKKEGIIFNMSSLATLYPIPHMPLYNASKSALSSFSESMILEYPKYPKFIDFRMGNVCTSFNASVNRNRYLNSSMQAIWAKIEKQLHESIPVEYAVSQILSRIRQKKSGTFYGGNFFQCKILPLVFRIIPKNIRLSAIKLWY